MTEAIVHGTGMTRMRGSAFGIAKATVKTAASLHRRKVSELSVPRRLIRGHEIQRWLEANANVTRWVVIDDDRMAIEEILDNDRCVFTNPARGIK